MITYASTCWSCGEVVVAITEKETDGNDFLFGCDKCGRCWPVLPSHKKPDGYTKPFKAIKYEKFRGYRYLPSFDKRARA